MMVSAGPVNYPGGGGGCGEERKRDDDEDKDRRRGDGWRVVGPLELDWEEYRPAIVLIIGDSFIRRLESWEHTSYGHYHNLGLMFEVAHIHWFGLGGLTARRLRRDFMSAITEIRPDVVVLQLGSNDLCEQISSADWAAADLQFLVQNIHASGAMQVILCQTLNRNRAGMPDHIADPDDYNRMVASMNANNRNALANTSYARFWHHRGLWNNARMVISRDGVHLNRYGNCLYFRNIRGAVLHGIRRARSNLRRRQ